jgi:hypothetical protein
MCEGLREMVKYFVEYQPKLKMSEVVRQMIYMLVKTRTKDKMGQRLRKMINWFVEPSSKFDVSERGRETVHVEVKAVTESELGNGWGENRCIKPIDEQAVE